MELSVNNQFMNLSLDELILIDGGTFWGVVSGVAGVVCGVAEVIGGVIVCATASKIGGGVAIVKGVATVGGGISVIVSNVK
ncbi:hypothetical protein [Anaerosporobacter sp.]|uniref:hypothetical protein n=1 Tax=Anaerosporobacter sp. TaxID=1872529 RepID=UPI00286F5637|nr:hypothetical protein [Anaerosporobacter sp.]